MSKSSSCMLHPVVAILLFDGPWRCRIVLQEALTDKRTQNEVPGPCTTPPKKRNSNMS